MDTDKSYPSVFPPAPRHERKTEGIIGPEDGGIGRPYAEEKKTATATGTARCEVLQLGHQSFTPFENGNGVLMGRVA